MLGLTGVGSRWRAEKTVRGSRGLIFEPDRMHVQCRLGGHVLFARNGVAVWYYLCEARKISMPKIQNTTEETGEQKRGERGLTSSVMNSKGVGLPSAAVRICPTTRRTAPRPPLRTMVHGLPPFCRIDLRDDSADLVSLEAQISVELVLTDQLARACAHHRATLPR